LIFSNPLAIEALFDQQLGPNHDHFHKLEILKGLILLRGHMRIERKESGLEDGLSPTEEPTYKILHKDDN